MFHGVVVCEKWQSPTGVSYPATWTNIGKKIWIYTGVNGERWAGSIRTIPILYETVTHCMGDLQS